MAETAKTIGFRGTRQYRESLARAALDRGVKVQGLIERAIEAYLAPANQSTDSGKHPDSPEAKNSQSSYSEEFSGWHRILEAILTSGDREAISAVQQNLRVFYRGIGDPDEILGRNKGTRKASNSKDIEERTAKSAGITKSHRQPGKNLPAKA